MSDNSGYSSHDTKSGKEKDHDCIYERRYGALARHHLNGGTVREIVGYVENGYVACAAKICITMDCVVGKNRGVMDFGCHFNA